ncbi:TetR/AcrR family transcriptional regulator [Listeria booriae]|uniref:TetR/AcrR family transcriptional regulator n=1 Tax=Listeria booriae TaxID=1552123 RepID=A0A7X1C088_9LIST|nr:TetR/AcrR family transcriptional regulator [Listeria booriae]MBC1226317.1 TetR/AcrR family transcriptional regulator [Listeria booriae]MBC1228867.1 TetR/AcrR family transcriptional regulator [Listeria booriae]MBC1233017.1 TetR/AcrR family transcriptional regulator [Listeria booriae]MBC1245468.1 TetR/AcrR family transcriptional regulator [Listeria booriae]MBC1272185.1 TetR/AcrR family transcriptional regulator [Listeria booriae]
MNWKEQQKYDREQLILAEAETMLFQTTDSTINMDALALAVGISKGTLYNHFTNKEAIITRILERNAQNLLQMMRETMINIDDSKMKLQTLLRIIIRNPYFTLVLQNQPDMSQVNELTHIFERIIEELTLLFRHLQEKNIIDSVYPTTFLVAHFMHLFDPAIFQHLLKEGVLEDHIVDLTERFFFQGTQKEM